MKQMIFTKAHLLEPNRMDLHYMQLLTRISWAKWLLGDKPEDSEVSGYGAIIAAVEDYNRSFSILSNINQKAVAASLIRIQLDNLIYLYAEHLNPDRVLYKVYNKDKELNQVLIANKPLKRSDLMKQLEERYNGIRVIWDRYSDFIHPSISHCRLKFNEGKDSAMGDMVLINQAITDILLEALKPLEESLKKVRRYSEYQRTVQEEISKYIYFTKEDEGIE